MRISGPLTGTLAMLGLAVSWTDARAYTPRSSRTLGGLLARQTATDVCAMVNGPLRVLINGIGINVGTVSTSAPLNVHLEGFADVLIYADNLLPLQTLACASQPSPSSYRPVLWL